MDTQVEAIKESGGKPVKPFRFATIGCGGIAQTHIGYLKKFPGVTCVAGCDIRQVALDHWKSAHGVEKLFLDYKAMLKAIKDDDVTAINVCTPNGVHMAPTVAALDAGYHVLCEKPPAMNAKQAKMMVDAAKRNGKQLILGFQHRYEPKSKLLRDYVQAGTFGKILYVRAQALRRRGIPSWGVFGQKKLQGGGPMIDIGVHIVETAHNIIGNPTPVACTGNTWTWYGNKAENTKIACPWGAWDSKTYTVEDMAVGMVRFDTGALMTIEASFVTHIEQDIFNLQIFGEKGGAVWDGSKIFIDQNGYMLNATPNYLPKWDIWEYKMRHFVEVCRDGRKNECPAEHGLMVQKILDGIYAASAKGREVTID